MSARDAEAAAGGPVAGARAAAVTAVVVALLLAAHVAVVEARDLAAWSRREAQGWVPPSGYVPLAIEAAERRWNERAGAGWELPARAWAAGALGALWVAGATRAGAWAGSALLRGGAVGALAAPLGVTLVGLGVFAMALAGALGTATWRVLVGAVAALGAWHVAAAARRAAVAWRAGREPRAADSALLARLGAGAVVATLAVAGLAALAPAAESDGLRYHLGAPAEWLKAGRLVLLPHLAFAQFPFLVEMHFLAGLAAWGEPVAGGIFAKSAHWAMWVATFGVLRELVARLSAGAGDAARRAGQAAAGVAWASMPAAAVLAGWSFIDHGIVLLWLGALLGLARVAGEEGDAAARLRAALVVAVVAGGLAGTKYTMLPLAAVLAVAAAALVARRDGASAAARALLVMAAAGLATGGPWLLKSAIQAGNPVHPLTVGGLLPTPGWDAEAAAFLASAMERKGWVADGAGGAWRVPAWLAWWWVVPHWRAFEAQSLGIVLPWALVVGGAWWAARRRTPGDAAGASPRADTGLVVALVAAGAAFYAVWAATYLSGRLLLPLAAQAALVPGVVIAATWDRAHATAITLAACCAAAWGAGAVFVLHWLFVGAVPSPVPVALGFERPRAYLRDAVNYFDATEALALAEGDFDAGPRWPLAADTPAALLLGEHRPYYFRGAILFADWFNPPIAGALLGDAADADLAAALRRLRDAHRVRHVVLNAREFSLYAGQPALFFDRLPPLARARTRELLGLLDRVAPLRAPAIAARHDADPGVAIWRLDDLIAALPGSMSLASPSPPGPTAP